MIKWNANVFDDEAGHRRIFSIVEYSAVHFDEPVGDFEVLVALPASEVWENLVTYQHFVQQTALDGCLRNISKHSSNQLSYLFVTPFDDFSMTQNDEQPKQRLYPVGLHYFVVIFTVTKNVPSISTLNYYSVLQTAR